MTKMPKNERKFVNLKKRTAVKAKKPANPHAFSVTKLLSKADAIGLRQKKRLHIGGRMTLKKKATLWT